MTKHYQIYLINIFDQHYRYSFFKQQVNLYLKSQNAVSLVARKSYFVTLQLSIN